VAIVVLQTLLEAVDALEQGFEDVCFGAALFGDGVWILFISDLFFIYFAW